MGKKLIIKGADFSANAIDATYSVILNRNDSTLGTVSGSGNYKPGSTITISATPIGNAVFNRWSDNNTNSVRQIAVTENINLIAYFVPQGYGLVAFNGTENWQFNADGEPNQYGIYNCYILDSYNIVKPLLSGDGFSEATCNIANLNRNINPTGEGRAGSQSMGFGYRSGDRSFFVRFNNTIATSVETFKAYLAKNNIIITYKQNT